ncbi:MAG: NAD-dependent epimerase/dehydratase family protein [Prolixibacteraceae bacterium]
MKCLVTGATGFIGNNLVQELLRRDHEVNVLVRSPHKLTESLKNKITLHEGDLFALEQINKAMNNCDCIFHMAAFANIWSKDKSIARRTNVEGTLNILLAAVKNNVKKVVFTSSAATLPPSEDKEEVNENSQVPETYLTDYETTKREAELLCQDFVKQGLAVIIVQPPRVFGPGKMSKSNSVTLMIKKYINGTWRIIPGNGKQIGNYAFIEDVVNGHILALENGKPGERYILGGTNVSYNQFFETLKEVSGKNYRMFHLPFPVMLAASKFELFMAETFGKKPLITPPWVERYMQNRLVSSRKAINELNYNITPLNEAMAQTIRWIKPNS